MYNELHRRSIRALCTDIDGTLLDSRRELSNETIDVIRGLSISMPIILASSRMPSAMRHLQQQLNILDHPLICYNGGYVLKYGASDKPDVMHSVEIPLEICVEILALAKGTSVHVSLYREDEWYAPAVDQWTIREATITKVSPVIQEGQTVLQYWQKENRGAHKVMCMGDAHEIERLKFDLRSKLVGDIHIYHSRSTYLELASRTTSKGTALKLLLEKFYDINLRDVIAFGDNYNDIDLLQSVGLGIAVANAREEVKAVAKDVTGDSKLNGVADAIRKYLLD